MSKYSLQTECLENIEAYSDEQFNAEMTVIESAMAIFDKAILMMELSNSDIDLPECSMFMESTFFQEQDPPAGNDQSTKPQPAGTNSAVDNSGNNNTEKKAPSDEERKAYNEKHWVRMKNKKGDIENIFISIIAFIPRLLGFIIQSVVRFFKKIFNKEAETTVKNADTKKAPDSAVEKYDNNGLPVPGSVDKGRGEGTWVWYDSAKVIPAIENIKNCFENLSAENAGTWKDFNSKITNLLTEFQNARSARVFLTGDALIDSNKSIGKALEALGNTSKNKKAEWEKFVDDMKNNDTKMPPGSAKDLLNRIKDAAQKLAQAMNDQYASFNTAYNNAKSMVDDTPSSEEQTAEPEGGNQNGG